MKDSKISILIAGTGFSGLMAQEIANSLDVLVLGFLTKDPEQINQELNDILIVAEVGDTDAETLMQDEYGKLVIAEDDIKKRLDLVREVDGKPMQIVNLSHAQATIASSARMGRGNMIGLGTYLQANSLIGNFNQIGAQVSIGIGAEVADYCTIQDGVKVGREAVIEEEAFVGIGAVIHPGIKVKSGAMVAAGAVVMQDVPTNATVFGNPAQRVKKAKK